MQFWSSETFIIAPSNGRFWNDDVGWQRGWGADRADPNAPIYLALGRLDGPLFDGLRTSEIVQTILHPDGSVSDERVLARPVIPLEDGFVPAWVGAAAFGLSGDTFGLQFTTQDGAGVDYVILTGPSPTAPLTGGGPVLDNLPATLERVDNVGRIDFRSLAYEVVEPSGARTITMTTVDPDTLALIGGRVIETLTDPTAFWNLAGFSNTRVSLLTETPSADVRYRSILADGSSSEFDRDFTVPVAADDVFFTSYVFYNEFSGADSLLVVSDEVGGRGGLRLIVGEQDGFPGVFTKLREARFETDVDTAWTFSIIDHSDADPRFGDILIYYETGDQALARLYDPDSDGFSDPVVIADGIRASDLGDIVDYDDGRYMLTWREVSADGATSDLRGKIVDVRERGLFSGSPTDPTSVTAAGELVGSALDDVLIFGPAKVVYAGAGDDELFEGAPIDAPGATPLVDGGDGFDLFILGGPRPNLRAVRFADEIVLIDLGPGSDNLFIRTRNVEEFGYTNFDRGFLAADVPAFAALDYIASHADLTVAFGADARAGFEHFLLSGAREGRAITFDGLSYLAANADLIAAFGDDAGVATLHYIQSGRLEGRALSFDALGYLAANADLAAAFGFDLGAATLHYVRFGRAEGRATGFDVAEYLAANPDLIGVFGADLDGATVHWIASGRAEGRGTAFDAQDYLAANPDLIAAFGADEGAARAHYLASGWTEGRPLDFAGAAYALSHPDLLAAFGTRDVDTLEFLGERHFIDHGAAEGRTIAFDPLDYIAANSDLIMAFGADARAGLIHYLDFGLGEGRPTDFDAAQYLANYADLRAVFGADEEAAIQHFIQSGFGEGRVDDMLV